MKYSLVCLLAMTLYGCGDNKVTVSNEVVEDFSGVWYFEEFDTGELSGALTIAKLDSGAYDVKQRQVFRSINPNMTYGTHPTISGKELGLKEILTWSKNVKYTSNNDLEKDDGSGDIGSGTRFTQYRIYRDQYGAVVLEVQIHKSGSNVSGGINEIVIDRTFRSINHAQAY